MQDRLNDLVIYTATARLDIDAGHDEGVVLGVDTSYVDGHSNIALSDEDLAVLRDWLDLYLPPVRKEE